MASIEFIFSPYHLHIIQWKMINFLRTYFGKKQPVTCKNTQLKTCNSFLTQVSWDVVDRNPAPLGCIEPCQKWDAHRISSLKNSSSKTGLIVDGHPALRYMKRTWNSFQSPTSMKNLDSRKIINRIYFSIRMIFFGVGRSLHCVHPIQTVDLHWCNSTHSLGRGQRHLAIAKNHLPCSPPKKRDDAVGRKSKHHQNLGKVWDMGFWRVYMSKGWDPQSSIQFPFETPGFSTLPPGPLGSL